MSSGTKEGSQNWSSLLSAVVDGIPLEFNAN